MKRYIYLCLCSWLMAACSSEKADKIEVENQTNVLVKVNGASISDLDLKLMTDKVLAGGSANLYAQEVEEQALDSMVMMMAIAQESEKKMSEQDLAVIESKTARYREELLTQFYMRKFADVTPPTNTEIKNYYESNKVLFGQKQLKQFELVRSKSKLKGDALKDQLEKFSKLNAENWDARVIDFKSQPNIFDVVASSSEIPNLDLNLKRVIQDLEEGEVSKIIYVDGRPNVIRLKKVSKIDAEPLQLVRPKIRKILAAKKLKAHIRTISAEILTEASVQYSSDAR